MLAYLAGDGAVAITAGSVDVTAADTSTIQALAGASAVAESVGLIAGSVSIGGDRAAARSGTAWKRTWRYRSRV